MVWEPALVKVTPGDTVKLVATQVSERLEKRSPNDPESCTSSGATGGGLY